MWNELTCSLAAEAGRLDVLQWCRANGCPWNELTCSHAAESGNLGENELDGVGYRMIIEFDTLLYRYDETEKTINSRYVHTISIFDTCINAKSKRSSNASLQITTRGEGDGGQNQRVRHFDVVPICRNFRYDIPSTNLHALPIYYYGGP